MSQGLYIGLGVSIGVALVVMIVAYFVTRAKINKIKEEYSVNNIAKGQIREDAGELLWDERDKAKNPLDDYQMDFLINTFVKNGYKTYWIIQEPKEYENISMQKLAKAKAVKNNADMLINFEIINSVNVDLDLMKVAKGGMLIYLNAPKKNKDTKNLLSYLKLTGIRHEHQKIGEGVVIIVK